MRRFFHRIPAVVVFLALTALPARSHLDLKDRGDWVETSLTQERQPPRDNPGTDWASLNGILTLDWDYVIPGDGTDHAMLGSSPAIANVGINNIASLGEQEEDLEIFIGNDTFVQDTKCLGKWFLLDSRGSQEWSRCTQSDEPGSSPMLADLNQDCEFELAGGTTSGRALEILNKEGTFNWYWPSPLTDGFDTCDYWLSSGAAGDIDPSNPGLEVVAARNSGYLRSFSGTDGTILWEKKIALGSNCFSIDADNNVISSPALGNIDGSLDGSLEIVVGTNNSEVLALDGDGNLLWTLQTGGHVISSPALADLDNDGKLEIAVGCDDRSVYLVQGDDNGDSVINASEYTTYQTGGIVRSSPAIGDTDGDGIMEIVVGSSDQSVYAFNYDAATNTLNVKWTYATNDEVYSSPSLADRTGSGLLDVYVGSKDGRLLLLEGATGALIDEYQTNGDITPSPAIADIDGDGMLEVAVIVWEGGTWGGYERLLVLQDNASGVSPRTIEWGEFRHDHMNTGRYGVAYPYLDPGCMVECLACNAGSYEPFECQGDSTPVTLDGSGSEGATDWRWEGSFNESPISGEIVSVTFNGTGTFFVDLTVSNGSSSKTCTVPVVIQDSVPPDLDCPGPVSLDLDASCQARFDEAGLAGDGCSAAAITTHPALPADWDGPGVHDVVYIATDDSGNKTVCSTEVTLLDSTDPTIDCPGDAILEAGSDCKAPFAAMADANDNCCVAKVTSQPVLPLTLDPGTYGIDYTATDSSGNTANCSMSVEVVDKTPPRITCPSPVRIPVNELCEASYASPAVATDNCVDVAVQSLPALPAVLRGVGPHSVVFTAKDLAGNTAECSSVAILEDETPPRLRCPAPVRVEADDSCQAQVPLRPGTADNCTDPPAVDLCPSGPYPLGTTEVSVSATDESGNESACTTSVTVVDTTPPQVDCSLDRIFVIPDTDEDEDPDEDPDRGLPIPTDHYTVQFSSADNCAAACCEATLNGFPVVNGQEVILREGSRSRVLIEPREKDSQESILVFEGPVFILEVVCTDESGNRAVCSDQVGSLPDEDEDDEEGEGLPEIGAPLWRGR